MNLPKFGCLLLALVIPIFTFAAGGKSSVTVDPPIPAPDWTLPAIQNAEGNLSMSDFRGKITYVDFWASWCGPCRLSLPALNSLNEEFADDPVQFLAISIDNDGVINGVSLQKIPCILLDNIYANREKLHWRLSKLLIERI